jgi:hypothetical protein
VTLPGSSGVALSPQEDVLRATVTRLRKSLRELDGLCAQQQELIRVLTAERDAIKEHKP